MNRMEARIAATTTRMEASQVWNWNTNIAPAATSIDRGTYFAGGPECLEARGTNGEYLGSIVARLVA